MLAERGMLPKKHMGQNFVADPSTAEMIVRRARPAGAVVLEIGAGVGALTVFAARDARFVYAVEKDRDLIEVLQRVAAETGAQNVFVINRSIFDVDLEAIARKEDSRLLVLGNLPYNISSQVLISLINTRRIIERAVLMLQTEMAQRLYARPGTKAYGRLSVMTQYCSSVSRIARVRANQFYPRPKVDSEVVEICFQPPVHVAADEAVLSAVVKAAFGQRRKTLKNALNGSELGIDGDQIARALQITAIDGTRRAETLSVAEFVGLANVFQNIR